jgi:sulfur relay (sulfurtransferase) DsrC/TusE family protein
MAKSKQGKPSVSAAKLPVKEDNNRLVSNSRNRVRLSRRSQVDARDVARGVGRFAHMYIQASASQKSIKGSIAASGNMVGKVVNDDQPMANVAEAWSRAISEVMSARMPDMISNYIIDLVVEMRQHFSKFYSSRDLAKIAKFVNSTTGEKLIADTELSTILAVAREQLHVKIVSALQDPACFELFKKHMRSVDV